MTTRAVDDRSTAVAGPGLARGPAALVGLVLSVLGLILFFEVSGTPLQGDGFPDGTALGDSVVGFQANAWTAWFTVAVGVVLLFGAAQHLAAKVTSLVVGLVVGAASAIALVDGDDVLGLAAANGLTALVWGVASAILLLNVFSPRLTRGGRDHDGEVRRELADSDRRTDRDVRRPAASAVEPRGGATTVQDERPTAPPTRTQDPGSPRS